MRIALLCLLLASPAPAAAYSAGDSQSRFEPRNAAREARAARSERREQRQAERAESEELAAPSPSRARRAPAEPRVDPVERPSVRIEPGERIDRVVSRRAERPSGRDTAPIELDRPSPGVRVVDAPRPRDRRGERVEGDRPAPGVRVVEAPGTRRRAGDTVADWRLRDRGPGAAPELVEGRRAAIPDALRDRRLRQIDRFARRGDADGRSPPPISVRPLEGTQPPPPAAHRPRNSVSHHWRGDWRRDHRYDWSNWRRRNHWLFRLGLYLDPFGWNYRRYHVGWRMWPSYYRSSYWLNDPWSYRLPYAPPGYRWIRYYDDALLVDTWDGRVVDVIHDFFW